MDKTIKTAVSIDYISLDGNSEKNFGNSSARPEREILHEDFKIDPLSIQEKRYTIKKRNPIAGLSYKKNSVYFQIIQQNYMNFNISIFMETSRGRNEFLRSLENIDGLLKLEDNTGFFFDLKSDINFVAPSFYRLLDNNFYNKFLSDIAEEIKLLFLNYIEKI